MVIFSSSLQGDDCAEVVLEKVAAIGTGFPEAEGFNGLAGAFLNHTASILLLEVVKLNLKALLVGLDDAARIGHALNDAANALAGIAAHLIIHTEHLSCLHQPA